MCGNAHHKIRMFAIRLIMLSCWSTISVHTSNDRCSVSCANNKHCAPAAAGSEGKSTSFFSDGPGLAEDICNVGTTKSRSSFSLVQKVLPRKHGPTRLVLQHNRTHATSEPKQKGPMVMVRWPRWGEPPTVTGLCILDGVMWSAFVMLFLYLLVRSIARFATRNAPTNDVDDSHMIEVDDIDLDLTPETYETYIARKRLLLFITRPESGPLALAASILTNITIFISVVTMTLESMYWFRLAFPGFFILAEWLFLVVFTMEWLAGLLFCDDYKAWLRKVLNYIDLLAVVPSYLDVLFQKNCFVYETEHMHMFFLFRLSRFFRILRLAMLLLHSDKVEIFRRAIQDATSAVFVCAGIVSTGVFVPGVLMYHVEQGFWFEKWQCFRRRLDDGTLENACSPFQNIPNAMYWAVTTITTVGYGDITPATHAGRMVASLCMLMATLSIAIPVGMITNSFNTAMESMKEEKTMKKDRLGKVQSEHPAW